jgi:hypothetical protein
MATTTWWGFRVALGLLLLGALFFGLGILGSKVKSLKSFRRWTTGTAIFAAILVLLAALPIDTVFPCSSDNNRKQTETCNGSLKDAASVANAIGPLLLSVSLALASVFYSAGEWYEKFQRFRVLGINDARADRRGRQSDRARFWQDVLRKTRKRIVISGTTLGGWFFSGWEETRESLLIVLPRAKVQVLLAHPTGHGFLIRADDPGEEGESEITERARPRAQQVYDRIGRILADEQFRTYITRKQLAFYTYRLTPLSIVWADDEMYFTPYLPSVSDRACPEFTINRKSEIGDGIAQSIESLLREAEEISTLEAAQSLSRLASKSGQHEN